MQANKHELSEQEDAQPSKQLEEDGYDEKMEMGEGESMAEVAG